MQCVCVLRGVNLSYRDTADGMTVFANILPWFVLRRECVLALAKLVREVGHDERRRIRRTTKNMKYYAS